MDFAGVIEAIHLFPPLSLGETTIYCKPVPSSTHFQANELPSTQFYMAILQADCPPVLLVLSF
jgi:hypothetical protein